MINQYFFNEQEATREDIVTISTYFFNILFFMLKVSVKQTTFIKHDFLFIYVKSLSLSLIHTILKSFASSANANNLKLRNARMYIPP